MPRKGKSQCSTCNHPQRSTIEELLMSKKRSLRSIGEEFHIPASSLHKHRELHMNRLLAPAISPELNVNDSVKEINARCLLLLKQAEDSGDLRGSLLAIKEVRQNLDLIGRLSGELNQAATINNGISLNEFAAFQGVIMTEVCPHCREAILTRLHRTKDITVIPDVLGQQNVNNDLTEGASDGDDA